MAEQFANGASTTLASAASSAALSIVVDSTVGFPATAPFRIRIGDEILTVTAMAGTTWTVTRASEAFAGVQLAADHDLGADVHHVWTAGAADLLYQKNELARWNMPDAGDIFLAARQAGDAFDRFYVEADGSIAWGVGSADIDMGLGKVGDWLYLARGVGLTGLQVAASNGYNAELILGSGALGGVLNAFATPTQAGIQFGAGGGYDTDLVRTTGGVLATAGSLEVALRVTADTFRSISAADVTLASTAHPFQIGDDGVLNLAIDSNEIQARNNGVGSDLHLNTEGGRVIINSNGGSGSTGLRIFRGGLALGTSAVPADDLTILLGADVSLTRSTGNVLRVGSGDRIDYDSVGRGVYKNTAQSIPNNTQTRISGFTAHDWIGLNSQWNIHGGNEIRVDIEGVYMIQINVTFAANVTGRRGIGLYRGNLGVPSAIATWDYDVRAPSPVGDTNVSLCVIRYCAQFDTLGLMAIQSSGGNLNVTSAFLSAVRIGL